MTELTTAPAPTAATAAASASPGGAPAGVSHPKTIKSFVRRAGRTTTGQAKAFGDYGPRYVLPYAPAPLDATTAFGRSAPLVLEIGFGMGEATAHIAGVRPGDNFLCCEVHEPGVGALLKRCGEEAIGNIRILRHDAVEVLEQMLEVLSAEPLLANTSADPALAGYAPKPDYRPLTKFEARGIRLGHGVWDLVFTRQS